MSLFRLAARAALVFSSCAMGAAALAAPSAYVEDTTSIVRNEAADLLRLQLPFVKIEVDALATDGSSLTVSLWTADEYGDLHQVADHQQVASSAANKFTVQWPWQTLEQWYVVFDTSNSPRGISVEYYNIPYYGGGIVTRYKDMTATFNPVQ